MIVLNKIHLYEKKCTLRSKIFSACDSVTWSQSYIESIFIPRGQSSTIFRISDGLFLSLSNSLSVLALIKLTF